jgi:hypothetical protein
MTETSEVAGRADADLAALAAEAFIYGFPLVADLEAVAGFTRQGMPPISRVR